MAPPHRTFGGQSAVHSVMEASPSTVVAVDADGLIGYVNPAAQAEFGYTREELMGKPVALLIPDAQARDHQRHLREYVVDPRPRQMGVGRELAARRKDGSEFPVEISLTPLRTEDRLWVIATVVDITARRATALQLQTLNIAHLTLARMNEAVVRATGVEDMYTAVCQVAAHEGGFLAAWVVEPTADGAITTVASAGEFDLSVFQITTDATQARGRGPTGRALRENVPCFISQAATDPATAPWRELLATHGVQSMASLPLRLGARAVAALTLCSDAPDVFDEAMCSLLEGVAENISLGLGAFMGASELRRVATERAKLVGRLVRAQEDERARIAADVHDESIQSLAVVDLRLGMLRRKVEQSAQELVPMVAQIQSTVEVVSAGLRLLLFELEPADATSTLFELFQEAASAILEGSEVRWSVLVEPAHRDGPIDVVGPEREPTWLPELARGQAVRVVKEALINVRKHSHASSCVILVEPDLDGVQISIVDDGVGVDSTPPESAPGHRGVNTMRDRVEAAGGWSRIDGGAEGTTVSFWMPRSQSADPAHG
jgi:PAS domain S-box-containing protein